MQVCCLGLLALVLVRVGVGVADGAVDEEAGRGKGRDEGRDEAGLCGIHSCRFQCRSTRYPICLGLGLCLGRCWLRDRGPMPRG